MTGLFDVLAELPPSTSGEIAGPGGAGLGTMWGWETAEAMLKGAGFREVRRHVLPHDPMNVWFVSRKA